MRGAACTSRAGFSHFLAVLREVYRRQNCGGGGNERFGVVERRVECQRQRLVRLLFEATITLRQHVTHADATLFCVHRRCVTRAKTFIDCRMEVVDSLA